MTFMMERNEKRYRQIEHLLLYIRSVGAAYTQLKQYSRVRCMEGAEVRSSP